VFSYLYYPCNCLNKSKKFLELPFNLWRYRNLSFSVSMVSPVCYSRLLFKLFLLHFILGITWSFQDKFTLKFICKRLAVETPCLSHFTSYYGWLLATTVISYPLLWIQRHFSFKHSYHVIQTLRIYKDSQTFTRSLASLLVGVRFNTLGVWAWDCTLNCENHAGGVTIERYVSYVYSHVFWPLIIDCGYQLISQLFHRYWYLQNWLLSAITDNSTDYRCNTRLKHVFITKISWNSISCYYILIFLQVGILHAKFDFYFYIVQPLHPWSACYTYGNITELSTKWMTLT